MLFLLIFTKFNNSFFQGVTSSNYFHFFKWIARESLLHKVPGIHKLADTGIQINTLQTQKLEITLP